MNKKNEFEQNLEQEIYNYMMIEKEREDNAKEYFNWLDERERYEREIDENF